ncbi:tRNA guanosine(34) transglycosylase Tgt [Trueperella pyogenes]|uniref:tRNA guanosine(34) transglycosylase Tgt n=1 Tax=Trueperella pyogenes TaxID=1661 RepID=UPI00057CC505|nr:tRNA guanosine(34) transglycosylase Tgt [Trueperella pyogenes]AJC68788.1 queuine tRNA-ribosyltransferase [Trueperella pyogenes TP8]ALD73485.1 queuine tRNA-ribosyltransferase [Trueperella pyogenes]AWG03716.1 tRNA-guanine(34) transglycosylase [Trueperella pyogenes]AWG16447.1 tRNA-guanine(34) transglycosylase [Trueperella pyogenes]AZR05327.1 tRNA guanosine(34) transglycosylase Tgt [Trueperella pyogenes]
MFSLEHRLAGTLARTGTIHTPHGDIRTPAFIPVGTKATVKATLPESVKEVGAQAVLSNAYHLYLQPGSDVVDEAGGLGAFMNWDGPTYTDSGGFQVMSLGSGFKKVLSEEFSGKAMADDAVAPGRERLANVDDDGVWFRSHLNGSKHRFTPEISMRIQHELGADIIFAFDELTTLMNSRSYQEKALERTRLWAERCLVAHKQLTEEREGKPYQQLFGVIQGAQYEDLRRKAARDLGSMEVEGQRFDGFGIGGALEKKNLSTITAWVSEELPEDKARHMLGISEPDDFFACIESGADTFDCVNPSRVARNAAIYSPTGRFNVTRAEFKRDFSPLVEGCGCYTCRHYTKAYIHHLFKAKEMLSSTLCTIHNEHFTVNLVDRIRASIVDGTYWEFKEETLGRFYG